MKNKIILIPDLHLQFKKPFYYADMEFLKWLSNSELNDKTNLIISLGDFFDKAKPETDVINLAIDFFHNKWKGDAIIIAGNNNHEYDRLTENYAITSLSSLCNVKCIYDIKEEKINNLDILFISWFYDNKYKDEKGNFITFKDYLNNNLKSFVENKKYDLVLGHLNIIDNFLSDYIDLSYINTDYLVCGHIHTRKDLGKTQSLGVCVPNSYGQDQFISQLMIIDKETKQIDFIDIPKFLIYSKTNYPQDFIYINDIKIDNQIYKQYIIYDIYYNKQIDKTEIINYYLSKKYPEWCVREIITKDLVVKENTNTKNNIDENNKLTIKDWLNLYIKENILDKEIIDELKDRIK